MRPSVLFAAILLLAASITPAFAQGGGLVLRQGGPEGMKPELEKAGYQAAPLKHYKPSGHFTVQAEVDGHTLSLIVDSGAGMELVLSKRGAETLGKEVTAGKGVNGFGGSASSGTTTVKSLTIPGMREPFVPAQTFVLDFPTFEDDAGKPVAADGILGASILAKLQTVFDPGHATLWVPAPGTAKRALVESLPQSWVRMPMIGLTNGFRLLNLKFGTQQWAFLFDSGAGVNVIEPEVAKRAELRDLEGETSSNGGVGAAAPLTLKRVEARDVKAAGDYNFPVLRFVVRELRGQLALPADLPYGGIFGSKSLEACGGVVDLGSSTALVPRVITLPAISVPTRAK